MGRGSKGRKTTLLSFDCILICSFNHLKEQQLWLPTRHNRLICIVSLQPVNCKYQAEINGKKHRQEIKVKLCRKFSLCSRTHSLPEKKVRIQKLHQRKVYKERTASKAHLEDIPNEAPCQAE